MKLDFYTLVPFIALIIHSLINYDVLFGSEYNKTDYVNVRPYRRFLFSFCDFFVVDMLWGIANLWGKETILYIVTILYNLCLAYVIMSFTKYVADYLEIDEKMAKYYKDAGKIFIVFACVVLIVNHFISNVFYIETSGVYKATFIRYVALSAIIVIFGYSIFLAIKDMKKNLNDSIVMLSFSIISIISSIIQMLNSYFPAYTIGFLIGSCFIHTFLYGQYKKETEKKLIEASRAKSDYLYSMSHDIRTPMNAIVGFSDLVEKHYDEKEKCLEYVDKIKVSSEFLLSLINNVLDIARIESGKATLNEEVWNCDEIDRDIYSIFEKQIQDKNITFNIKRNVTHNYCYCDKVKLREIYLNLISNAIKYTPVNGSVSVSVNEIECSEEGKATYEIKFSDTGVGMSKEYLPHVFDKFTRETTSKSKDSTGTGLGLPIVKSIVDLMGGTIKVESTLGVGTTFTVTFTLRIGEKPKMEEKEICHKDLSGKHLLVVEDNDINAMVISAILDDMKIKSSRACDGKEALDKILNNSYDAILMDIQMPYYNGYEVTKEVRSKGVKTPIIAMTASAFEEDRLASIEVGMDDFVSKPIELDKLKLALSSHIN